MASEKFEELDDAKKASFANIAASQSDAELSDDPDTNTDPDSTGDPNTTASRNVVMQANTNPMKGGKPIGFRPKYDRRKKRVMWMLRLTLT